MAAIEDALRGVVTRFGWQPGTHLENQVALILSRCGLTAEQQYRVGRYRLDFAWPDVKIGLEADGWWHRSPEGALKDRTKDSWLRSQGWVIFRIDDEHGEDGLCDQVTRAAHLIRDHAPADARWCLSLHWTAQKKRPHVRYPLARNIEQ